MQKKVLYSLGAKFSGNKYRIFTINKNSGIVADKNTKSIQWTVQNGQWQKKVREKFLRLDWISFHSQKKEGTTML